MTEVQSSFSHFTQQPQSIPWHLQYALDNASRQGTMQCQETCRMDALTARKRWTGEVH